MKDFDINQLINEAPEHYQQDLRDELELYRQMQETTKAVLAEVGVETKNQELIELMEGTGLAGYDASTSRLYVLPDLIDQALELAPKTFPGDEGMNVLGLGGIPPFLYREGQEMPMPASYEELDHIIKVVGENLDVVRFLSQPVKVHKGDALKCNQIMDQLKDCIKVTCSAYMHDDEGVKWFMGREDWHDSICGLKSPLICMDPMMDSLMKTARAGNNVRLTTMPLSGRTAPQTPEGTIIINQAEVLFMLAVVQTIKPGLVCLFGGMPCPTKPNGDLAYSTDSMDMLNVAVARLNMWVTGLPTYQSGGSTECKDPDEQALNDGIRGRQILCDFGTHNARHCFGVLDNLNFFSEKAFLQDCEAQRRYLAEKKPYVLKPLYTPHDEKAFEVIQRVASGDYHVDHHTTSNFSAFENWEKKAAEKNVLP